MSEVHLLSTEEGTAFWFLNSLTTVKATGGTAGGAYLMIHQIMPPGFATPYHSHRTDDEACYVLAGELTFFSDGQRMTLGSGGYISLPQGIPHGFRNDTAGAVTVLFFAMPGEDFLGFLEEASEPAGERRLPVPMVPDFAKLARISEKYGVDVLGSLPE